MLADLPVLVAVDEHLGRRHRAEAEGRRLADRRFLEQERGRADRDQIEEALVDLDREGRALEMAAHPLGDVLEIAGEGRPVVGVDIVARAEAEPLRPGRRQLGQQAGGQLLDRVGRGAVEQAVAIASRRCELGAEPDAPLRQGIGVAFAPERLPGLATLARPLEPLADRFAERGLSSTFSLGCQLRAAVLRTRDNIPILSRCQ